MADTPLELYEEAYRLHYHDKKIPEAIRIYETIIREFPESNECGYAFIQLQKVKANDISKILGKKGPATMFPMAVIAFVAGICALAVAILGTVFMFQQLQQEHRRSTLAMLALGKMYAGSDDFALKVIDQLKIVSSTDVLVSEFTSDVLKKRSAARTAMRAGSDSGEKQGRAPVTAPSVKPVTPPPAHRPARQNRAPIYFGGDSISYF